MPSRQLPYGAFNFEVNLDGITAGFSDVSGLNTELTIAEYRNGNEKVNYVHKVAGLHKAGDVTLKRGIISSDDLWAWLNAARVIGPEAKRVAQVVLLSESGEPVQRWTLHGCLPMKYTGPTLAAKGGGDVALEELVLSVEAVEQSGP
jgi:phage tail-like protein